MGSWPLLLLLACLLTKGTSGISISTISATNETSTGIGAGQCMQDEPSCSCPQPALMKCFCPLDETYDFNFHFEKLDRPFDLLQIGACRRLTLFGVPFAKEPPEFLQIFDSDNVFHDLGPLPISPIGTTPYPPLITASRPIRRIEFLNVTIAYLALADFYALNRIEQFIIQNSTVKVLGGRPPETPNPSNMGSIQLLSSIFLEIRKGALDVVSLDAFLLTNSTVHAWNSGAVRLGALEGALVVVSNCSIHHMGALALTVSTSGHQAELHVESNRIEGMADDVFSVTEVGKVDFRFRYNWMRDVRPRALVALQSAGSADVSANVFPCAQALCLGDEFQQGALNNSCWMTSANNSDVIVMMNYTAALRPTDEVCLSPNNVLSDDEGQRPSAPEGAGASATRATLAVVAVLIATALLSFVDGPI